METYRTFFNFRIANIIDNSGVYIVWYNDTCQMITNNHAAAVKKLKKAGYFFKK